MPFTRVSLKSLIPKPYDFDPITLGDHVRKKRLQVGLYQKDVAGLLGVCASTVLHWEKNRTEPPIAFMPAILEFLGYDPFPIPRTLAEQLRSKRRERGWSIKKAAESMGVDPGTWAGWESGEFNLRSKHQSRLARLLSRS